MLIKWITLMFCIIDTVPRKLYSVALGLC